MHGLLRSVWDEPRPLGPPARPRWDWTLVAVFAAAAVAEGLLRPDLPWRALSVVLVVALLPVLLWRRARPVLGLAAVFGVPALVSAATGVQPGEMYTSVVFLLLPYALLRWGAGRQVLAGAAIVLAEFLLQAVLGHGEPTDVVGGFAVLFSVGALGAAQRYRASARSREADRARLLERERIARDLHDTVAHHVSAVAIRAQAGLAVAGERPDAAVEALGVIEFEASRALADMRTMVHLLRQGGAAELEPGPGVDDIGRLVRRSWPGVPSVRVRLRGDFDGLSPLVGTALYRLAQESVTNARRHARRATRIEVDVTADGAWVRLRVGDDGAVSAPRPAGGYGIAGMAERAELLGGTCTAGPAPGGGWTVTAELPRSGRKT
ncbi:sensor histidine kinase [Nocardiopsis sp. LOL_012]|uniref:sensor histidine kinase n=1 Tax=Nocardiopsis sp. LOL_012 TaxID=3345409 RepID=UPI003A83C2F0